MKNIRKTILKSARIYEKLLVIIPLILCYLWQLFTAHDVTNGRSYVIWFQVQFKIQLTYIYIIKFWHQTVLEGARVLKLSFQICTLQKWSRASSKTSSSSSLSSSASPTVESLNTRKSEELTFRNSECYSMLTKSSDLKLTLLLDTRFSCTVSGDRVLQETSASSAGLDINSFTIAFSWQFSW